MYKIKTNKITLSYFIFCIFISLCHIFLKTKQNKNTNKQTKSRTSSWPILEQTCISACGITQEIVNFPRSGNTLEWVKHRTWNYAKISEFSKRWKYTKNSESPHAETQEEVCKNHMRIYTISCVFPHEEIHAEMCMSAWGNTRGLVYYRMR